MYKYTGRFFFQFGEKQLNIMCITISIISSPADLKSLQALCDFPLLWTAAFYSRWGCSIWLSFFLYCNKYEQKQVKATDDSTYKLSLCIGKVQVSLYFPPTIRQDVAVCGVSSEV